MATSLPGDVSICTGDAEMEQPSVVLTWRDGTAGKHMTDPMCTEAFDYLLISS